MSKRLAFTVLVALLAGIGLAVLLRGLRFASPAGPVSSSEVTGARRPQRVICMSPAVTEMVYALGQGHRVVAISQFTTYPPEALEKPQCGGFFNPDVELILSLEPDLIISQGIAKSLTELGQAREFSVLTVTLEDLDSVFGAISAIGRALGCEAEADRLCAGMRLRLAATRMEVAGRRRPRVFVAVGREPDSLRNLMTVGKGSFLSDVLEVAGGENIFADLDRAYPTVSKESLLERQAEVIIELHGEGMMPDEAKEQILRTWRTMPALPAVKDGRIHIVEGTYAQIPGPRITRLAEELAAILHPAGEQ